MPFFLEAIIDKEPPKKVVRNYTVPFILEAITNKEPPKRVVVFGYRYLIPAVRLAFISLVLSREWGNGSL